VGPPQQRALFVLHLMFGCHEGPGTSQNYLWNGFGGATDSREAGLSRWAARVVGTVRAHDVIRSFWFAFPSFLPPSFFPSFLFLDTASRYIARLTWNSRFSCLCLQSAGIIGMNH
jgi:hypothetical protein